MSIPFIVVVIKANACFTDEAQHRAATETQILTLWTGIENGIAVILDLTGKNNELSTGLFSQIYLVPFPHSIGAGEGTTGTLRSEGNCYRIKSQFRYFNIDHTGRWS